MKFEEAYCPQFNKTYTIEDVSVIYKLDATKFVKEIKDCLYCPECKRAKLSFNNAIVPYFKTFPKSQHDENCSLRQEEMNARELIKYIDSAEGKDRAVRNIASLMTRLLDESINTHKKHNQRHKQTPEDNRTLSTQLKKSSSNKRFPQKRIDTPLTEEDYEIFKLFYGAVLVEWEFDIKSKDYKLILRHTSTEKFLCRIKVTPSVYAHLNSAFKFKGKRKCKIVFLANLRKIKNTVFTSLSWSNFLDIHFDSSPQ